MKINMSHLRVKMRNGKNSVSTMAYAEIDIVKDVMGHGLRSAAEEGEEEKLEE
jgi:hypothetical protein